MKQLVCLVICIIPLTVCAQGWDFKGELAFTGRSAAPKSGLLRYVPELSYQSETDSDWMWDFQAAAYLYAYEADDPTVTEEESSKREIETHRLWFRTYNDSQEVRLGLQEISFGPAQILRVLKWYDTKDPLDPTSFTKGVKGLLWRMYRPNNSNYWFWGLYDNDGYLGNSSSPSDPEQPEFGVRMQQPLEIGEWGVSVRSGHSLTGANEIETREQTWAVDVKLDLGIGLWMEASHTNRQADNNKTAWIHEQQALTLGLDTSFDIGNGLYLLLEKNWTDISYGDRFVESGRLNALMTSYPVSLLDQLRLTAIWGDIPDMSYVQLDWQQTYDTFLWNLAFFQSRKGEQETENGAGLTLQWNH